ncbi:MAG: hypothetical protein ABR540_20975 [Acidimicrobiales bacterium]
MAPLSERARLLRELEAQRAQGNAEFNRALLRAGCPLPTTTTTTPTSTTPTSTTTTTTPSDLCAQIRQSQQAFNARIDAQIAEIPRSDPSPERSTLVILLEAHRADGNVSFNRQLVSAGCSTTTSGSSTPTVTTTTTP